METRLFKKAGELSVLCGVDVAVIAMSPARKVFAFGSPSADAVVSRFLGRNSGLGELERYMAALEELKCKVMRRADELAVATVAVEMKTDLLENFLDSGSGTGDAMVDPFLWF
ncbi:hypothetical protein Acr_21g0000220 [Actinidia rufa]|uniref:MADS-box domain-containing protein n=1 Tax=Actinidia rufa TaxID=165716 RepID=A0A7J0GF34_9ERIC|nr:hypothetical protein Acr_21g0000220 [Actinidia rufa]